MLGNLLGNRIEAENEIIRLRRDVNNSEPDTRADVSRLHGGFAELAGDIKNIVKVTLCSMNLPAEYVERISKGDIPGKIIEEYAGDFNEIKNSPNICDGCFSHHVFASLPAQYRSGRIC